MAATAAQPIAQDHRRSTGRGGGPRRSKRQAGLVVRIILAVVVGVVMAFPLYIMLVTAFSGERSLVGGFRLLPRAVSTANFERVFEAWPVGDWFVNSVTITTITTFLTVVVSVLAGYAFAKLRFPAKTPLFLLLLATMMIPTQAILVPQFRIVNDPRSDRHLLGGDHPGCGGDLRHLLGPPVHAGHPGLDHRGGQDRRCRRGPDLLEHRAAAVQAAAGGAHPAHGDVPVERLPLAADRPEGPGALHACRSGCSSCRASTRPTTAR